MQVTINICTQEIFKLETRMVIGVVNLSRWLKGTSSSNKIVMSGFKTCGSSDLGASLIGGESGAQEEQSVSVRASAVLEECLASSVQSTPEIEKKYVHRVYDAIAPHFSSTRFAKWPKVATFLNSLAPGSLILDAGCGNGKYLGLTADSFFIGCDISAPLVGICADRGHEVVVADAVNLPYRTGYGDAAISIAVLHHLSTEIRRRKAIDELVRVVKRGGLVLITVWAVEQEDKTLLNKWTPLTDKYVDEWIGPGSPRTRSSSPFTLGSSSSFALESIPETEENGLKEKLNNFRDSSSAMKGSENGQIASEGKDHLDFEAGEKGESHQEYFVPWHLPYHRAEVSGASVGAVANGLAKKDDKKGAIVYNRYYHVFSQGELERLVSGMKNAVVVDRFYDKSNWCIILRKT
ncbi:tRNA (carboxymethyluridine(34)-5-O)-methyltransferase isoform X1 [Apium graveolens]|uniref:tRNA (carboxymethyluridine(34)-5-O)-methyltransferase isoform X1 n=3 Tax=Apium graveolens TaxID=4045 RepID=UPI003D78EB69